MAGKEPKEATIIPNILPNRIKREDDDEDGLILTEGFEKLSKEERERSLNDLHGVGDVIEETNDFVTQIMDEFDLSISKTKWQDRTAYDKAVFLNPNYVRNKDFRLVFLRSESE